MKLLLLGLLAALCPAPASYGQIPTPKATPLQIGDTIPGHLSLTNIHQFPVDKIQLSQLKGKLVLLDFWSTWCASCIEAFPKMQALQQTFGDSLQVFLVNAYPADSLPKVLATFQRLRQQGRNIALPFCTGQTAMAAYFPHKFVPHYAWIGPSGTLLATTSAAEVTEANIRKLLAGSQPALHTKGDRMDFQETIPLGVNNNGTSGDNFRYRSLLTGYIEGIGNAGGWQTNSQGLVYRFYLFNTSALMLLKLAHPRLFDLPTDRVHWLVRDPGRFATGSTEDTLLYRNAFCYDLSLPPSPRQRVMEFIRSDIDRFFGIRVDSASSAVPCLALQARPHRRQPPADRPGMPASDLAALLHQLPALGGLPVVCQLPPDATVPLLPENLNGLSRRSILRILRQHGLQLANSTQTLTHYFITDKY
ncbi:TlpA family protein disulfide reductase [Flavihumibacter rivuli]|uniref:TlpA family protein disulfide reductase n=1 Tax=Flavihumibacter rivuli TaxID=2838156 RepID=UPI001BDEBDE3|nr:TlpA disulfide reductase family protein [Flavihumibacter rivuli]ULQ55859.1 TlpA family protein disulfide reductase [Flavihumibacter rivuli]